MPRYKVFSFMILAISYLPTDRVAVYMHIQRAHKNRNLYAAVGKVFICLYFFYNYYFTISRRYDGIFIYCRHPFGHTKKRNQEKKQAECYNNNNRGENRIIKA